MSGLLTRFRIEGLHNLRTIDVAIEDNKLVLVGENGTGKTTVANFIYFFLTHQWRRLLEYKFKTIMAVIDSNEPIVITYEDIQHSLNREITPENINIAQLQKEITNSLDKKNPVELLKLLSPGTEREDFLQRLTVEAVLKLKEREAFSVCRLADQVLYLPTYRRIEQDLRFIFPDRKAELKELGSQVKSRKTESAYLELIEFGMDDVETTIKHNMETIKENVRADLNKLTGTYLRDVIRALHKTTDLYSKLSDLDESAIMSLCRRIPPEILSEQEQNKLKDIIKQSKQLKNIQDDDKVAAYFLLQLLELHTVQEENERPIHEFVRVCNRYLSNKEIIYDPVGFELFLRQFDDKGEQQRLAWKDLSSGEKQIVSLFSHLYLAEPKSYFVIIDEPELSLSVPWQRRFLTDILETKRCHGLIAVTHSPFVYDNELRQYAHSLEEFMEVYHGLS